MKKNLFSSSTSFFLCTWASVPDLSLHRNISTSCLLFTTLQHNSFFYVLCVLFTGLWLIVKSFLFCVSQSYLPPRLWGSISNCRHFHCCYKDSQCSQQDHRHLQWLCIEWREWDLAAHLEKQRGWTRHRETEGHGQREFCSETVTIDDISDC